MNHLDVEVLQSILQAQQVIGKAMLTSRETIRLSSEEVLPQKIERRLFTGKPSVFAQIVVALAISFVSIAGALQLVNMWGGV